MPTTNVDPLLNAALAPSVQVPPTVHQDFVDAHCKIITDFTWSMSPIIDQVRRNISIAVEEAANMGACFKPAFIVVRDIPDDGPEKGLRDDGFMDVEEFKRALQSEPVIGNTTIPESQLDAVLAAIVGPWPNMKPRRPKHIVLTTDSGTHPNTQDGKNTDDVVKLAHKYGCRIHVIGPGDDKDYLKLTGETGGFLFDIDKHNDSKAYKRIFSILGRTITQTAVA